MSNAPLEPTAAKRATTARYLEARAAVVRHGPGRADAQHSSTGTENGQGSGRTPPQPSTRCYDLDDDSVPELGGTRPDRLADVRPQKRVQRHTVDQIIDPVPLLPTLDDPAPKMVDQLAEFLKIGVVQVLEVPKSSQDSILQRRLLSEPQLVELLVDVPVPEMVILARGKRALGLDWCQVAAPGRGHWWQKGTRHVKWDPGKQILGAGLRCSQIQVQIVDEATPVADVRVIVQLMFQQFFQSEFLQVPQIHFFDRVLDIPVATQRMWPTVQQNVEISQVFLDKVVDSAENCLEGKLCRRSQRFHSSGLDVAVCMQ